MKKQNIRQKRQEKLIMLCFCGIAVALEILLNRFVSINTAGWKIGFSFLAPAMVAILYGPLASAAVYGLADLIGALLFPIGTYHPGFTVCAALMGICYGMALHSDPIHFDHTGTNSTIHMEIHYNKIGIITHILPCVIINSILLGLVVNTAWVAMLYGSKTYWGWFFYRVPEYLIMIPVQMLLLPVLLRLKPVLLKFKKKR